MRRKIFIIFLILLKFSASQVTFPDAKKTTSTVITVTTPLITTTTPTVTIAETSPKEETEPQTEEAEEGTTNAVTQPETSTEAPQTSTSTEMPTSVEICAAINQCVDIGGKPQINMTGRMDVRVNNVSRKGVMRYYPK